MGRGGGGQYKLETMTKIRRHPGKSAWGGNFVRLWAVFRWAADLVDAFLGGAVRGNVRQDEEKFDVGSEIFSLETAL
jgi:hypothetical protein